MKHSLLYPIMLAAILSSGCNFPLDSHLRADLMGDPAPVTAVTRTIVITPQTRHVNVTGGEVIGFIVGDKSFGWHFSGPVTVTSFELNRAAPPGMLDHKVMAYILPNPMYIRDGRR